MSIKKIIKTANYYNNKYNFEFYSNLFKIASSIITKEISLGSSDFNKYKDQIKSLLTKRYKEELNYNPTKFSLEDLPDEMLASMPGKIIISIDPSQDKVVSVSGIDQRYGANRVKMFAGQETSLANAKIMQAAMFQQLKEIFKDPNTFAEFSYDLFEKFEKLYKFYSKVNNDKPFDLYYLPAESAVKLIPGRKIKVSEDGVSYEKRIVGAGAFSKKIVISNSPVINGAVGYPSFEEASSNAQYKNKLIEGTRHGGVRELSFNPEMWRK